MSQTFCRGRLIDHVHLRVRDLEASKRFYRAVLAALGRAPSSESERHINFDELWIDAADEAGPSRVHLAFQTDNREAVARFYQAGLAAGGRDNGGPGERQYHRGYYAAFLLDPDGHNIVAVHHGDAQRNVAAIELKL